MLRAGEVMVESDDNSPGVWIEEMTLQAAVQEAMHRQPGCNKDRPWYLTTPFGSSHIATSIVE